MSVTASGSAQRLDIGQALQDVLKVFLGNFGPLALLGVLLVGLPLSLVYGGATLAERAPVYGLLSVAGIVGLFVGRPILFGAVIFLTASELDGQATTFWECLTAGRRRWGTMLGLTIWSGLLIGLGMIFLIVPGVFLAVQWAVAGPAVVLSGRGISDSMDKSASLTKGNRWAILLLYLVVFVGFIVASLLLGIVSGVLTLLGPKLLASAVTTPLSSVLLDVSIPLVAAVLFRRLRGDADGERTAALAEVFA